MSKSLISSLAVIVIFVFILGCGAGIFYQSKKDASQFDTLQSGNIQSQNTQSVIKDLSSKVVLSSTAYGQVSSINGRDITLTYEKDSLKIKVKDDVIIYAPTKENFSGVGDQPQVQFENIKEGDNLNVSFKLLSNGTLEGQVITIIPNLTK